MVAWLTGEMELVRQLRLWAGSDVWVTTASPGLPWVEAVSKHDILLLPGRVPVCLGLPRGSCAHHPEAR